MDEIESNDARVNITYDGDNGDLPETISYEAADEDIKFMVSEAIAGGSIPGITAQDADLSNFVVDRFAANEARPFNLIQVRPKIPFGAC